MKNHTYRWASAIILTLVLNLHCNASFANVQVQLQDPQWSFLISNINPPADTQLQANERQFARSVQPLLAEQKYSQVLQAFNQRPLEQDSVALQLLRGQVLLSVKELPEAARALKAALNTAPDLALAHRSLSMVYMLQKNYSQAQTHLIRTIELGAADAQVYGQLAFVNLQQNHAYSAVAGYQQALFLQPNNAQWQQGLVYALTQSHALTQAQALVEEMLEVDSSDRSLWLLRSQIAMQQQRHQQALSSLEIALRLGDKQIKNITTAAQLHLRYGSLNRAVMLLSENIQQMSKQNQNDVLQSVEQAAAWLAYQRSWPQLHSLLTSLDNSSMTLPKQRAARIAVYRAQYALHKGNQKQARQWLQEAIIQDPNHGEAILSLANLLSSQKQADSASLYYIRAQALDSVKERALLGHAQLEIDRKEYAAALKLLHQALKNNPERRDIAGNIRALEKLVRHSDAG